MENFRRVLQNNRDWAANMKALDPEYFIKRSAKQEPHFLYIGCADSSVPASVVTGSEFGDSFVHRNIANLVLPSDLNGMSVLQFALEVLDVKHVIVAGHYGCSGVKAAISSDSYGLVDHWLQPIRNVVRWNKPELDQITDEQVKFDRIVELNVLEQLYHLSETPVIQNMWAKGRRPLLHGLVYDIHEGILREIATGIDSQAAADQLADRRLSGVPAGPPPMGGRNSGTSQSNDDFADAIARRVAEKLSGPRSTDGTR